MNHETNHDPTCEQLDVARLGDYVDRLLAPADARAVEAHLANCAGCRARLHALRALLARAAQAPASIDPPRDLWPAVRARIAAPANRHALGAAWWRRGPSLVAAAAALLVVGASAATTRLAMRLGGTAPPLVDAAGAPSAVAPPAPVGVRARYGRLEREYVRAAAQLTAAVEAERGGLDPATVAAVEQSVRTIDAAIAEARAALERDPHNAALVEMLSASYGQKLGLLKRAAQLPSDL